MSFLVIIAHGNIHIGAGRARWLRGEIRETNSSLAVTEAKYADGATWTARHTPSPSSFNGCEPCIHAGSFSVIKVLVTLPKLSAICGHTLPNHLTDWSWDRKLVTEQCEGVMG